MHQVVPVDEEKSGRHGEKNRNPRVSGMPSNRPPGLELPRQKNERDTAPENAGTRRPAADARPRHDDYTFVFCLYG
jgi:hypothetical protein